MVLNGDTSVSRGAPCPLNPQQLPRAPSSPAGRSPRLHRSVTDGHIPSQAQEGSPSKALPTKTSYFDTYQPYKLNPALTPSIKSSRSKSEKNLRQSRDKQASVSRSTETPKRSDHSREKASLPPSLEKTEHLTRYQTQSELQGEEAVERRRRLNSEKARHHDERTSRSSGPSKETDRPDQSSTGKLRINASGSASVASHAAGLQSSKASSIDAWRQVAREAAARSPGGYSSRITAGVTRRNSQQDLKATRDAVCSAQKAHPAFPLDAAPASQMITGAKAADTTSLADQSTPSQTTCGSRLATASSSVNSYRRFIAGVQQQSSLAEVPPPKLRYTSLTAVAHPEETSSEPSSRPSTGVAAPKAYSPSPMSFTRPTTSTSTLTPPSAKSSARSIDDIIKDYTLNQPQRFVLTPPSWDASIAGRNIRYTEVDDYDSDESADSITREVKSSLALSATSDPPHSRRRCGSIGGQSRLSSKDRDSGMHRTLHHASSFHAATGPAESAKTVISDGNGWLSSMPSVNTAPLLRASSTGAGDPVSASRSSMSSSIRPHRHRAVSSASSLSVRTNSSDPPRFPDSTDRSARSSRLNQFVKLSRAPNCGLKVSFADVGDVKGHPVIVYLGLGAVRYLVGLYDELAFALHLRLICVDRWGMGKTDDVPNERRGLLEWVTVVEEVAEILDIASFSVLAHSAGAPYAMAMALLNSHRVVGPIHLLAPWVSPDIETSYRWVRYIPEPILRTAQAAEWRMAGWRLGKSSDTDESSSEGLGGCKTNIKGPTRSRLGTAAADWSQNPALPVTAQGKITNPTKNRSFLRGALFGGSKAGSNGIAPGTDTDSMSRDSDSSQIRPLSPTMRHDSDGHFASRANALVEEGAALQRQGSPTPSFLSSFLVQGFPDSDVASYDAVDDLTEIVSPRGNSSAGYGHRSSERPIFRNNEQIVSPDGPPLSAARSEKRLLGPRTSSFSQDSSIAKASSHSDSPCATPSQQESPGGLNGSSTVELAQRLLRASHTESVRTGGVGSTSDLMTILGGRSAKPWGFSFKDVQHPVKVWHGEKDERISLSGAMWMERECPDVSLKIVKGANHGLMTNTAVVIEALESVAAGCRSK
ncbi:unnamed protein product [Parajaminaea phylloscopi]